MSTPLPLTEENLSAHTQQMESTTHTHTHNHNHTDKHTHPIPSWVEELITEERIRLSISQHALTPTNPKNISPDDIQAIMDAITVTSPKTHPFYTSKLWDTAPPKTADRVLYRETPLERFLTPGNCEPCYFDKMALAAVGIQYGSLESCGVRRAMAERNVEVARMVRRDAES
ncbi:hypothetical protein BO70DRAFT_349087 [Aspergillus heteromorphus CBS 117.55]|uniref:Uncharacterized protein n=1 Tax=Aspergillus heteromorphus CBS 117.55 TaxID=1448321 RepID=A0A317X3N4_9EURO|nr:uncharacterized protein BO70DRAFT_349087 [Aspergillus heteromorphus CBS 117.55]PWY92771.1 hypothetical protein BO70DRAFT_349087 [Aspergillus heteromorphus CBS 117.55]